MALSLLCKILVILLTATISNNNNNNEVGSIRVLH